MDIPVKQTREELDLSVVEAEIGTIAVCDRGAVWIKARNNHWVRHEEDDSHFRGPEQRTDYSMGAMMDTARPFDMGVDPCWALY